MFGAAIGFRSVSDVPPTLPVRADEVIAYCGGSWQRSRTPTMEGDARRSGDPPGTAAPDPKRPSTAASGVVLYKYNPGAICYPEIW